MLLAAPISERYVQRYYSQKLENSRSNKQQNISRLKSEKEANLEFSFFVDHYNIGWI